MRDAATQLFEGQVGEAIGHRFGAHERQKEHA